MTDTLECEMAGGPDSPALRTEALPLPSWALWRLPLPELGLLFIIQNGINAAQLLGLLEG